MKDVTADYIAKEEAPVRKPVELFKIWFGDTTLYYTNGDVAVTFDDGDGSGPHVYTPATISRGAMEYDSTLDVNTMKVQFGSVTEPTVQYIAQNPVAIVWVEISRLFRDQDPLEKSIIFIGQIKTTGFKGVSAEVELVGFEHFLSMPIPVLRYQIACNHQLFDTNGNGTGCELNKEDYDVSAVVTIDATGTILTSATFATYDDGYFVGGLIEFGEEKRTIVGHVGSVITLQYRMQELESGDTVTVYPGCDGDIETCRDKFNNIVHFLGFPWIPQENPATRIP